MLPSIRSLTLALPSVPRSRRTLLQACLATACILFAGSSFAQLNLPGTTGNSCDPSKQSCAPGTTPGGGTGPSACGPGKGGDTCDGTGPAGQGNSSGTNVGAGNPINLITGNKYQREVDLPALPGVLGLEIVRHYNSTFSAPNIPGGILGRGWKLSYETELYAVGRTVQIVQADGTRIIFARELLDPSQCVSPDPAHGTVRIEKTPRGDEYTWTWRNGRKLNFNSQGKLVQILAPSGEFVSLQHDPKGMLLKVTDPQGRTLRLNYLDKQAAAKGDRFRGVQSIDSPVGRFTYAYGSDLPQGAALDKIHLLANLVKVGIPTHYDSQQKLHAWTERGITSSSISRLYHYEDARHPTLLTGISVTGSGSDGKLVNQRLATYGYNIDGKGILSTHADNVNKVTLDYSQGGQTVITNSLGQSTTYRHAIVGGAYRLLDVRGAGCASCGETNVRYAYDKFGRLTETTQLNPAGQPIQGIKTELDYHGRTIKVSRITYRNGKAGQPQWLMRYEYQGDDVQPALIARPSVVPGKEAVTRISYNEQGQPTKVTDSGWSPAHDGKSPALPIARSITYSYSTINGRSLLTQIGGPLANGKTGSPVDSDITRVEWDSKGNAIVAMTVPGNFKSTMEYDDAGRIAAVTNAEGHKTSFTYDARNQLIATVSDGITQSAQYDAQGNKVEIGYGEGKTYKAGVHFGFDGAGRNTWAASHLGILARSRYDTEGKLLEAATQSASFKQTQQYVYDPLGRLIAVTDAAGGTRRIGWNAQNLPGVLADALGRETRYRYDETGNLAEVIEAANTAQARRQNTAIGFEHDALGHTEAVIAPNGATTRYVRDDFGRTIAVTSPDSGTVTRNYDAASRLVASRDANGNRASYEYDVTGRIVRQTVTEAKAMSSGTEPVRQQTVTAWTYEGKRLAAIDHPGQAERYRYDDKGHLAVKTVILKLANGGEASSITRYRYDELGQLQSASLPDGSTIDYRRNGQNQVVALERSVIQTPWLRWLLPTVAIAKDLERDIVGLKHFIFGNGIEAKYQRSKEGALARIVYRHRDSQAGDKQKVAALDAVLGIPSAHAAQTNEKPIAPTNPGGSIQPTLPGALSLPQDRNALIDHRYLWDVQGNLLHTQSKDSVKNYAYDAQDRLIVSGSVQATKPDNAHYANYARYFYDGAGNRVLAQEDIADQADTKANTVKIAYAASSNRWQGITDGTGAPQARHDATGQPDTIGKREYVWDALGKLIEVRQENRTLAAYRYNHKGERIGKTTDGQSTHYLYEGRKIAAELDGKGQITRQYIYLADQPIAVIDTPRGHQLDRGESSQLAQIATDIVTAFKSWFASDEMIAYLHNNHLGATELATDDQGNALWRADYGAYGKVVPVSAPGKGGSATDKSGFKLNLRLLGQYADEETGLYYNDHRYYDPSRGQYLTPDPLGLRGGINSYAYVKGNPLRYIDPSGLILFAFDGTENTDDQTWLTAHNSSLSNVMGFRDRYNDGNYRYITGVGTVDKSDPARPIEVPILDAGVNWSGPARIARMIEYFNDEADLATDDNAAMNVDIIGFSRGAAQARDFANQIVAKSPGGFYRYKDKNGKDACQKVKFRFMGLWDTVLSNNWSGYSYNLAIPTQFSYVAQAVALNEYRGHTLPLGRANLLDPHSWGAFPLESIKNDANAPDDPTRVELGFVGAHADIGGGFKENELSKVALVWMLEQADKAGVKMKDTSITITANPVLHDKSDAIRFGSPTTGSQLVNDGQWNDKYAIPSNAVDGIGAEDRTVRYRDGTTTKQRQMIGTGMTYADTEQFITYDPTRNKSDNITGTVNMDGYLKWLQDNGYGLGNLTIN